MLELGTPLPPFSLPDTNSPTPAAVSSTDLAGRVSVVAILCNHCPYVKHIANKLAEFGDECAAKGVPIVAISANDVASFPDDSPERMAEEARRVGYHFPYLYDETQAVALAFHAACTPEFYVFDTDGKLAYRGRFDESTPRSGQATGKDLRAAVDALLACKRPSPDQKPSIGCSIKWKDGNAPEYLR